MGFFEFNIAVSGLFAAQRGLHVTSNNIANATTPGYSRQVLAQQASTPLSGMGVGMVGTGVDTRGITRVRDSYIDVKLWSQNDKLGEYRVKVEQNSIIESVFGEPSEAGFTKVFNDLFNSVDNLSKLPTEKERQAALRQQMINYTKYFNNISASLSGFQRDLNFELKTKVDEINLLATRIQSLNRQIYQAEIYGDDANTFRDARELAVDRLSQLVNVETKEVEVEIDGRNFKQFSVKIAGQTLVDHLFIRQLGVEVRGEKEDQINQLVSQLLKDMDARKAAPDPIPDDQKEAYKALEDKINDTLSKLKKLAPAMEINGQFDPEEANYLADYEIKLGDVVLLKENTQTPLVRKKVNDEDIDSLYDVVWKDGLPFDMGDSKMSGELKGVIDMRDGCGTGSAVNYNGIPYYIKRMDEYVRQFAKTMNEEYSKDADGYIALLDAGSDQVPKPTFYKKVNDSGLVTYYNASKEALEPQPSSEEVLSKFQPKYQLFTYTDGSSSGAPVEVPLLTNSSKNMTAANFSIAYEIFENAANIRTNYEHYPESDTNPNPSSNNLLMALSAQKSNKKMFKEGDPKDYMIAMFSELGINTQEATMYQRTQTSIVNNINNQRLAVSQVDTNEEFVNLIKYQQAYQAAAKIINTIDGIYETTIFRLGSF